MPEMLEIDHEPAWRLGWLTPMRCRLTLLGFLLLGLGSHLLYLHSPLCVDLSGDEAQYWDWSRHLDLSYYSKGPLIAYIIHASCALFGGTMPAVRYPALLLSAGTSIFAYLLTRLLFNSERLALGATLLFAVVPMFIAGSVLMTIDPPMFFCWAGASYFAARGLFSGQVGTDGRERTATLCWVLVGVFVGLGFLAKYAEFLFFIGVFGFVFTQRRRVRGPIIALATAAGFTLPVIIWNQRHNWVSLRHVARQTGAQAGSFAPGNVIEMIGGQLGTVGPTISVLMVAAILYAIRMRRQMAAAPLFLVWIGVPFFLLNLLASLRAKVQLNWPAPAYFTLTILVAWFLSQKLANRSSWRLWRGWFWASVAIGLIVMPIAHDTTLLYPIFRQFNHQNVKATLSTRATSMPAAKTIKTVAEPEMEDIDPLARLRGWRQLGAVVFAERQTMSPNTFVMCDDYMQTAEMAFYQPDHPATYCAGPYFGKRFSQYDMWPDRRLDPTSPLVGRDAIYIGKGTGITPAVAAAFDRVEKLPELPIRVNGSLVRTFKLWRCTRFHGMTLPPGLKEY